MKIRRFSIFFILFSAIALLFLFFVIMFCLRMKYASTDSVKPISGIEFAEFQEQENNPLIPLYVSTWEYFNSISEDDSIFDKYSVLKDMKFYFVLCPLKEDHNLKDFIENASINKDITFVIEDAQLKGLDIHEIQLLNSFQNIILIGHASDRQIKALINHCKAFVVPQNYDKLF